MQISFDLQWAFHRPPLPTCNWISMYLKKSFSRSSPTWIVVSVRTLRPNLVRYMISVLLAYHKKHFVSSPQIFASWHCLIVLQTSSRFTAKRFRIQLKIGGHTNIQIFAHTSQTDDSLTQIYTPFFWLEVLLVRSQSSLCNSCHRNVSTWDSLCNSRCVKLTLFSNYGANWSYSQQMTSLDYVEISYG